MDQLDGVCMDDAQSRDADDDGEQEKYEQVDGDPGATPRMPAKPQVARRLEEQYPSENAIHMPVPRWACTRSARGPDAHARSNNASVLVAPRPAETAQPHKPS